MSERSNREEVNPDELTKATIDLGLRIGHAFHKHGKGKFLNAFETLGVLQLEFDEYKAEVQNGAIKRQRDELLDVACVAIVAAASIGRQNE